MSDPVIDLLEKLVKASEESAARETALATRLDAIDRSIGQLGTRMRALEGAFERQDGQLNALQSRIAGNYKGLAAQYDELETTFVGTERALGDQRQELHSLRVVVSSLGEDIRGLRERWGEEASHSREGLTTHDQTIEDLIRRQEHTEERIAALEGAGGS